ncbi:MAG: diacylglycerol kinase family protein [Proteiniphilum sp.]|nr:diacylglycerol kinase family protein [Proteiniphilum sp.]
MGYIKNRILSFRYAFRGAATLFRETPNIRLQLAAAIAAVITGFSLHISREEWLAIIIVTGGVFAMEAMNSALEHLSDFTCRKEIHPAIKKVKDISAAAVLLAAMAALAVEIVIFLPKIILLLS